MLADTIEQVLAVLDARIARARARGSPEGYFAALYRKVTARVRDGIGRGEFEDGERMERLDVVFANRYLEACDARDAGARPTAAWQVAFDATHHWSPIVLQHLLLGMNAHINLDLGIAAASVAPGQALPALRRDFERINDILADLTTGVKDDLGAIWPLLRVLDVAMGTTDDAIATFSMRKARGEAWAFAEQLAGLPAEAHPAAIHARDCEVALLGKALWRPHLLVHAPTLLVRVTERGSVADKIDLLAT